MVKGVIFDADGTLLDSMTFWDAITENLIMSMGIAPSEHLTELLTPMSMREGAEYLCSEYGLNISPEEIIEKENRLIEQFYSFSVEMRDGTLELLSFLKENSIPAVVASATDRYLIESALKHLGILGYFEKVFSCSEIGKGKSSPEIYLAACDYMHTAPNETVVIEDSLQALTTAKKAGFLTIAIYDGTQKRNWEKSVKISDLSVVGSFNADIIGECFDIRNIRENKNEDSFNNSRQ